MPSNTIVLIHGFWVTPRSWEEWIPYYEAKGFEVIAPAYPGFEVEVEALNADPTPIAETTLPKVVAHLEQVVGAQVLPDPEVRRLPQPALRREPQRRDLHDQRRLDPRRPEAVLARDRVQEGRVGGVQRLEQRLEPQRRGRRRKACRRRDICCCRAGAPAAWLRARQAEGDGVDVAL